MEDVYRQLLTEWAEKGAFCGGDSDYKKDLLKRTRAALSAAEPRVQRTACTCCRENGCQSGCMCWQGESE